MKVSSRRYRAGSIFRSWISMIVTQMDALKVENEPMG